MKKETRQFSAKTNRPTKYYKVLALKFSNQTGSNAEMLKVLDCLRKAAEELQRIGRTGTYFVVEQQFLDEPGRFHGY